MIRRGMFSLSSPSSSSKKHGKDSPSSRGNKNTNNNNNNSNDSSPFARPMAWELEDRDDHHDMISDDSAPPAPPVDALGRAGSHSGTFANTMTPRVFNRSTVSGEQQRQPPPPPSSGGGGGGGGGASSVHNNSSWDPAKEIPKGSVQHNPFIKKKKQQGQTLLDENTLRAKSPSPSSSSVRMMTPTSYGKRFFGRKQQQQQQQQQHTPTESSPAAIGGDDGSTSVVRSKKKGILKFFGGHRASSSSKHSKRGAVASPAASFEVQDTTTSVAVQSVVSQRKAQFDSAATNSQASSRKLSNQTTAGNNNNNNNNNNKSFINNLSVMEPTTKADTNMYSHNHHHHSQDDDNSTVSNLTNPTYFQSVDPKSWPINNSMEDTTMQQQPPKMPNAKVGSNINVSPPKEEEEEEAALGDFFVAEKTSMDSWEKGDAFSDPFFEDKDATTPIANSNSGFPSLFVKRGNKTVEFPDPITDTATPQQETKPPRSALASTSPAAAPSPRQRRRSMQSRSPSPRAAAKTTPGDTKDGVIKSNAMNNTGVPKQALLSSSGTPEVVKKASSTASVSSNASTVDEKTQVRSASPRRHIQQKMSQRYQVKSKQQQQQQQDKKPSLSIHASKEVSSIYHVATSPTKKASGSSSPRHFQKKKEDKAPTSTTSSKSRMGPRGKYSNRKKAAQTPPVHPPSITTQPAVAPPLPKRKALNNKVAKVRNVRQAAIKNKKQQPNRQDQHSILACDSSVSTMTACTALRKEDSRARAIPVAIRSSRKTVTAKKKPAISLQINTLPLPQRQVIDRDVDADSLYSGIFSSDKQKQPTPDRLEDLRYALHRPRFLNHGRTPKNCGPVDSVFSCYDESKVQDPLARAGLRLLSASVAPMQAAARGFLARRGILTKWWAALVIQSRFRAHIQEEKFLEQQYAAIQIQRVARGVLVFQRLCLEDYCATEVQKIFRGHIASNRYRCEIHDITICQAQWRSRQARKEASERHDYLLLLQAWVRGAMVRNSMEIQHLCATEIQRYVRGHQAIVKVYEAVYNVTLVQSLVRRRQAIALATDRMDAVLALQSVARGCLARRQTARCQSAALTVQCRVRSYLASICVYEKVYNIMVVQSLARRRRANRIATERLSAIVRIQSQWRTYQVQAWVECQNLAATEIQRVVRGYLATLDVYEEIYRITLVQNCWRRVRAKKLAQQKKQRVIQLEAVARGYIVRRETQLKKSKAVVIQSAWRSFFLRLLYQFKLLDIIVLQSLWRRKSAMLLLTKKRNDLHNNSATLVQTQWRCYIANTTYRNSQLQIQSAIKIQAQWRSFDANMQYLDFLSDVVAVQCVARCWLAKRQTKHNRQLLAAKQKAAEHRSAVKIQSVWRMYLDWSAHMLTVESTIVIQSVVRGFLSRCARADTFWSVVVIQAVARGFLARRRAAGRSAAANQQTKSLEQSARESKAALDIQTLVRCHQARDAFVQYTSARKIQSMYRCYTFARPYNSFRRQMIAATKIQASWRGFMVYTDYLFTLCDVLKIQSAARAFIQRYRYKNMREEVFNKSATAIQASWRCYQKRASYNCVLLDATKIQSAARGLIQRTRYIKMRKDLHNRSAASIQALWRGFQGFTDYQFALADYITVQSCARRWIAMRRFKNLLEVYDDRRECSACLIQTRWRLASASMLLHRHKAARSIQNSFRGVVAFSILTNHFAARSIQNNWRIAKAKKLASYRRLEHCSATKIQSSWRGFVKYSDYLCSLYNVIKVQSIVRCRLAQRQANFLLELKKHNSATTIQTQWRCFEQQTNFLFDRADIILVQACIRRHFACKLYSRICDEWLENQIAASSKIQATWRMHVKVCQLALLRTEAVAATKIQSTWRGYASFGNYMVLLVDIIRVQNAFRSKIARKQLGQLRSEKRGEAATAIQSVWRKYTCFAEYSLDLADIITVQSCARRRFAQQDLEALRHRRDNDCAVLMQKVWRGYSAQEAFMADTSDIIIVQSCTRRLLAGKEAMRCRERRAESCAATIQKMWRGYFYQTSYIALVTDVVIAQSQVRKYFARKDYVNKLHVHHAKSATSIQKVWRTHYQRVSYLLSLADIVIVQAQVRKQSAKKELAKRVASHKCKAARSIQAVWRSHFFRTSYEVVLADIIIVQAQVRKQLAQKNFKKQLATLKIASAVKIQSAWRSHFCKTNYDLALVDIISVQSQVRKHFARKEHARRLTERVIAQENASALTIQTAWRSHFFRTSYEVVLTDIIVVQSQVRNYLACKEHAQRLISKMNENALVIQTAWRSHFQSITYLLMLADIVVVQSQARKRVAQQDFNKRLMAHKNSSAIKIQTAWRSFFASANYTLALNDIVLVQACARRHMAKHRCKQLADKKRSAAAKKIQSVWRGYFVCTTYAILYADIVKVQCLARVMFAKRAFSEKQFEMKNTKAVLIQKVGRGMAVRRFARDSIQAAINLQRCWRGFHDRLALFRAWKDHENLVNTFATKIQKTWRAYIQRQNHLYKIGSVIQIQSVVRMSLVVTSMRIQHEAATKIQTNQRRFQGRMHIIKLISSMVYDKARITPFGDAATQIQCAFRRYAFWLRVNARALALAEAKMHAAIRIKSFFFMVKCKRAFEKEKLDREQTYAATTLQLWYQVASRVRAKRRARAGLKIYKFLKMVKAEVDAAIRAEEKKRKFRQKMRNRTKELDDEMLEGAWEKVEEKVEISSRAERPKKTGERPSCSNSISSRTSRRSASTLPREVVMAVEPIDNGLQDQMLLRVDSLLTELSFDDRQPPPAARSVTTSRRNNPPLPPIAPRQDMLISPTAYRVPRPRMTSFNSKQIEQDQSLEEAYLDVEISGAKERRMADKLMKQERRRSRSSSRARSSSSSRAHRSGDSSASKRPGSTSRRSNSSVRSASTTRVPKDSSSIRSSSSRRKNPTIPRDDSRSRARRSKPLTIEVDMPSTK